MVRHDKRQANSSHPDRFVNDRNSFLKTNGRIGLTIRRVFRFHSRGRGVRSGGVADQGEFPYDQSRHAIPSRGVIVSNRRTDGTSPSFASCNRYHQHHHRSSPFITISCFAGLLAISMARRLSPGSCQSVTGLCSQPRSFPLLIGHHPPSSFTFSFGR